jgi:hypothetical protein
MSKLAKAGVVKDAKSYTGPEGVPMPLQGSWKQQKLTDKLRRTGNKEVVIMDDYDGKSHKHGVFDALTSPEDDGFWNNPSLKIGEVSCLANFRAP